MVREHQAGLRAFIRALGAEADWVDDLAQEVFLIAYRKQAQFDNSRDFGRWLRGIARRHVANERRKDARRSRLPSGALADVLMETSLPDTTTHASAERALEALRECVGQLPERGRELLRRRYEANENAAVLAPAFAQSAEALRQNLHRLRLAVKRCVEGKLGAAWP
ncbi:MAG: sigma-70 family RNA polymerase sigma factor [Verrucomicrobia bacterium]|nr:sigma-70 family RNA polymerase sigma factor [Verrucomicrobiota bacterium]